MTVTDFYNTLFDPGAKTCFSYDCRNTKEQLVSDAPNQPFFIINSLEGGRKDTDVSCYRNFLIEFDTLTVDGQYEALKGVPYSTLVWSGGKSLHAIISLQTPCDTKTEYDALARRIKAKLPDMDKSTSNAARFSRCPEQIRDNGNLQELLEVGIRIAPSTIENWLGPAPQPKVYATMAPDDKVKYRMKSARTNAYLQFGESVFDGRNNALFEVALDLARCKYSYDEILAMVEPICTLSSKETYATIRSAIKTANND